MKRVFLQILFASLVCTPAFADGFHLMNSSRFSAPNYNGYGTVGNPQIGDIIFDTNSSDGAGFWGYSGGSWVALGAVSAPTGALFPYAGSTAPAGYLLCDGSAVDRTAYAALFAIVGTTYGAGNGTTTFNVPDTRGIFLRGAGTNGQITASNGSSYSSTEGTYQNDQFQGHYHSIYDPGHSHPIYAYGNFFTLNSGSAGHFHLGSWDTSGDSAEIGTAVNSTGVLAQAPSTDGTNGTPNSGAETRPANLSILYIIKY